MEEISLRELIEILIKQKKIIAIITIVAIIVSGIISFFILDPIYQAKTILMASGMNTKAANGAETKGIEDILDNISRYPQMTIEAYKEQIKNPQILDQVIKELKLDEKDINRVTLRNIIDLSTIKDTNLITITVKNSDKLLATNIANTIAKKFTIHVSDLAKTQAEKSSNYVKTQMEIEKAKLDEALVEYKEYLSQPQGLDELKSEIASKTDLITDYKASLIGLDVELKKASASLEANKKALSNLDEKIVLKKSILDDSLISNIAIEKSKEGIETLSKISMETEEINEVYQTLKSTIIVDETRLSELTTEKSAKQKATNDISLELEELQAKLADNQYKDDIIKQKVNFAQSTYESFLNKYEETRILKSSDIGEASIIIVSPAVEPLTPIGPNKKLNVAIAGVLGLMISVFAAFFIEYWKTSGNDAKIQI